MANVLPKYARRTSTPRALNANPPGRGFGKSDVPGNRTLGVLPETVLDWKNLLESNGVLRV